MLEQISEKKEKEDYHKIFIEKIEYIPIYKKLYPSLKDLFIYDENNEINDNLIKIKQK